MNDKLHSSRKVIVYEEFVEPILEVSDDDVKEYSHRLGIDLTVNPSLATSVRDWILQPLPRYWYPCLDTETGNWFYSNSLNGQSSWYHPLEEIHRNLAKQYCAAQHLKSEIERENPEGESAEQSMESGLGSKSFGSALPSIEGGVSLVRNQLPRALAPLKRVPKIEPITTTKSLANTLPSFNASNVLRDDSVRDVSFSTFKSTETIPSLLPSDILFENRDRPAINLAPFNESVLAVATTENLQAQTSFREKDAQISPIGTTSFSHQLLSSKKHIPPITNDSIVGKSTTSSFSSEFHIKPQESKHKISFTERLAAKKASRVKSNELIEPSLSNPTEPDETTSSNPDKKHVQFDLETKRICQYTPECSEEAKIADKSESSSSEDILDLIGDPEFLKPLSDINCYPTVFEERRWDVSFTSFGLSPVKGSPVKVSPNVAVIEDSHEMVTRFNSESCPSPLPVANPSDCITTDPAVISTNNSHEYLEVLPISIDIPESTIVPDPPLVIGSSPVPKCNGNADDAGKEFGCSPTHVVDEHADERVNTNAFDEVIPPTPSYRSSNELQGDGVNDRNREPTIQLSHRSEENIRLSDSTAKNKVSKLLRSSPRSNSLEDSIVSSQESSIIQSRSFAVDHVEPNDLSYSKPAEMPKHSVESDVDLNIKPTASQLDLLSPPRRFSQDFPISEPVIASSTQREVETSRSPPLNESENEDISVKRHVANPSQGELLRMKQEMESSLECEKKKLEDWFAREIAQIKTQFELELASERRRTENLSRLVENAKLEKENVAKLDMTRLQETLAHLVEEKTRQVQLDLKNEILSNDRSVCRQDANIQTEEPPPATPLPPSPVNDSIQKRKPAVVETDTNESDGDKPELLSQSERRESRKRDSRIKCQCDSLQKQVARVEKEMQLLKQKNLSFQKNPSTRKKCTPVKAQRESWWPDTDDSTASTASSTAERHYSRRRSQSMTNLLRNKDLPASGKKSAPIQRTRDSHHKSHSSRKAWMDDYSNSSGDTPTSGISSAVSTGEWDTVLSSIQKISGDLQEVWSHIGPRPRPLSYLSHSSSVWMPSSSSFHSDRVPLHWSFTGSTAERTQALRLWLQQNKIQHSKAFL